MTVCTCWDIPRPDCCYCGAYDEWEQEARAAEKTQRSYDHAIWAFGMDVFRGLGAR